MEGKDAHRHMGLQCSPIFLGVLAQRLDITRRQARDPGQHHSGGSLALQHNSAFAGAEAQGFPRFLVCVRARRRVHDRCL